MVIWPDLIEALLAEVADVSRRAAEEAQIKPSQLASKTTAEQWKGPEALVEKAKELWRDLCEKDDRTSPEDYPDMALITEDEFTSVFVTAALDASGLREARQELERLRNDAARA